MSRAPAPLVLGSNVLATVARAYRLGSYAPLAGTTNVLCVVAFVACAFVFGNLVLPAAAFVGRASVVGPNELSAVATVARTYVFGSDVLAAATVACVYVLGPNVLLAACAFVLGPFAFLAADTAAYTFELGTTVTTVDSTTALGSSAFLAADTAAHAFDSTVLALAATSARVFVLRSFEFLDVATAARAFVLGSSVLPAACTFVLGSFEFPAAASVDCDVVLGTLLLLAVTPGADRIIFAEPFWNPGLVYQCVGRAHRMGQIRPVSAVMVTSDAAIEQLILRRAGAKQRLAEAIFGGDRLPTADALAAWVEHHELLADADAPERSEDERVAAVRAVVTMLDELAVTAAKRMSEIAAAGHPPDVRARLVEDLEVELFVRTPGVHRALTSVGRQLAVNGDELDVIAAGVAAVLRMR